MILSRFVQAAEVFLDHLEALPEGAYVFNFDPSTGALAQAEQYPTLPPVLVSIATVESVSRCLSAFEHWVGSVRIGALRCSEGLLSDFWIA